MSPEAYRQLLLAPARPAQPSGAAPSLPSVIWFAPPAREKPVSLSDLYATGIDCGHEETRAYLRERVAHFDAQLESAQADAARGRAEIADLQAGMASLRAEQAEERRVRERNARNLEDDLARARQRIDELEGSTFWRMTLPLRAAAHRGKLAMRGLRRLVQNTRMARARLGTARQIAKHQGMMELLRRVGEKATARGARDTALRARPGLATEIAALHIAASSTPRVSVVIPTYGQDLHTFTCLTALAAEAVEVPLEVIVMDDCAPTPAAEALRSVSGVRFERNLRNLGFVRNCNRGAALARGEYLLFLNNDAVLTPGSVQALLRIFSAIPAAGAAGAKLVYPDGRLQEAGGIVWRDGSAWNAGRGENPDQPEYNYVRDADYCSAACLMVPRGLFEQLGGFEERYAPAYYEDTDLCFRIREAGRRVIYQPAAEAVHFEGVSHGTSTSSGLKRHQLENQRVFHERWQGFLAAHRPNGQTPRLERDRHARYRVLFVEACMLTPDHDSGSTRTWRLIEVMQSMGCKVTFVADNLEDREPYRSRLQQRGVEVLYAPYAESVDAVLDQRGPEFDVVVLARYYIASHHIDAVRRYAPRAVLVFDTIDLHYLRQRRLAAVESSVAAAQAAQAIHREEMECIRRSDLTWVVSHVERDILADEVPRARVEILTNIHDVASNVAGFRERQGLLFVGGFRHPPNVDAALWYAREIAPRVAQFLPGVTAYFIGSNAPRAILDLEGPGIEVLGYVEDLEPWLRKCRLSISPLRYGAGVKGKVNQSMSYGLPVVATSASVEGMHLEPEEEVLIADDPEGFAAAVARLYGDERLWNRLSRAGQTNIERHFSRQVAAAAVEDLFALVERKRAAVQAASGR